MFSLKSMAYEYMRNKIDYPLVNKFLITKNAVNKDGKELAQKYLDLCYKHDNVVGQLIGTMDKCKKLEAENEFMLKLINQNNIGE